MIHKTLSYCQALMVPGRVNYWRPLLSDTIFWDYSLLKTGCNIHMQHTRFFGLHFLRPKSINHPQIWKRDPSCPLLSTIWLACMQAYLKGGLLDHNQTSVKIFCAKLPLGKPQRGHLFQNGHNYCAFFTNEQWDELLSNAWCSERVATSWEPP